MSIESRCNGCGAVMQRGILAHGKDCPAKSDLAEKAAKANSFKNSDEALMSAFVPADPKESSNTAKCLCDKEKVCPIHDNPSIPKEPSVLDIILEEMHEKVAIGWIKNDGKVHNLPAHATGDSCVTEAKSEILKHYIPKEELKKLLKLTDFELREKIASL